MQSPEAALRFAAITALQRLAQRTTSEDLDWLVLLCDTAANDVDALVRRGGFEFCLRVLHKLPFLFPAEALSHQGTAEADVDLHLVRCKIVAVVQRLLDDDDASVRHAVAAHCCSLCCLLGGGRLGQQWSTWILDALHNFLRDPDAAVRCTAVDAVPFIVMLLLGFSHGYMYADPEVRQQDKQSRPKHSINALMREALPGAMTSWSEVERSIRKCEANGLRKAYDATGTQVVSEAIHSGTDVAKRAVSLLLPAIVKLSSDQSEDIQLRVVTVLARVIRQLTVEHNWQRTAAVLSTETDSIAARGRANGTSGGVVSAEDGSAQPPRLLQRGSGSSGSFNFEATRSALQPLEDVVALLVPTVLQVLGTNSPLAIEQLLRELVGGDVWSTCEKLWAVPHPATAAAAAAGAGDATSAAAATAAQEDQQATSQALHRPRRLRQRAAVSPSPASATAASISDPAATDTAAPSAPPTAPMPPLVPPRATPITGVLFTGAKHPLQGPGGMLRRTSLLSSESLSLVVGCLADMARRRDWRVRELSAKAILAFAPFADTVEAQRALTVVCAELLQDRVGSVRLTAAESLCCTAVLDLREDGQPVPPSLGEDGDAGLTNGGLEMWRDSVVVPQVYELMQRPTARQRALGLYMVQVLVPLRVLPEDVVVGLLLPLVLNAAEDHLPNVRLGAARALMTMVPSLLQLSPAVAPASTAGADANGSPGSRGHANLERCLQRLCADADPDVRQFAVSAAAAWGGTADGPPAAPPAAPAATPAP